MAPEQARALGVSARSDIFALGVVLWEMLTLKRLFREATDIETLKKVVSGVVPPIRYYRPEVPSDISTYIHRMLKVNPADRPESMISVEETLLSMLVRNYRFEEYSEDTRSRWLASVMKGQLGRKTQLLPRTPSGQNGQSGQNVQSGRSGRMFS